MPSDALTVTPIRLMTAADLPMGMALKSQAGWNQTLEDWQRFLTLAPQGCFVAEGQGQAVGTAAAFTFGPVGWIAMVLVDQSMRGKGIGKTLMLHVLAHLDAQGIARARLDATPLGRPLYEKLGFVAQFELTRFAGTVQADGEHQQTGCDLTIRPATAEDLPGIIALDQAVTATPRRALIQQLFRQQPEGFQVAMRDQQVVGYASSRPGALAAQVGPVIAAKPAVGSVLLQQAIRRHVGRPVFVDIPCQHEQACHIAQQAGLTPQRNLTRMTRGQMVLEQIDQLWAGSGPEKG